ncbi:MAG: hypothetical protein R3B97_00185 [Dehalococcoidia bacterium]
MWVRQSWVVTMETLNEILRESDCTLRVRRPEGRWPVAERVDWGPYHGHSPFFEGESEPHNQGARAGVRAYFGFASDRLVERLLGEHLADGG